MSLVAQVHAWEEYFRKLVQMGRRLVRMSRNGSERAFNMCDEPWFMDWYACAARALARTVQQKSTFPVGMWQLMSQTHNHSVLKRMRLRNVLRLRQALLTRDLKAFEATATDKACRAAYGGRVEHRALEAAHVCQNEGSEVTWRQAEEEAATVAAPVRGAQGRGPVWNSSSARARHTARQRDAQVMERRRSSC